MIGAGLAQSQYPNDRAADDKTADAARDKNEFHDVSECEIAETPIPLRGVCPRMGKNRFRKSS